MAKIDPKTECSFCRKTLKDVRDLIEGSGEVYICDECVNLSARLLYEKGSVRLEGILGDAGKVLLIECTDRMPSGATLDDLLAEIASPPLKRLALEGRLAAVRQKKSGVEAEADELRRTIRLHEQEERRLVEALEKM